MINTDFANYSITDFNKLLASSSPVPGGGGAAALVGAIGTALGSMVANLTIGKEKYASVEDEMKKALNRLETLMKLMESFIQGDADAFSPLAAAYKMPKSTEEEQRVRKIAINSAKDLANVPPMETIRCASELIDILGDIVDIGNKGAVSDIGVAAVCAKAAIEGAVLNVYINGGNVCEEKINEKLAKADSIYAKVVSGIKQQ